MSLHRLLLVLRDAAAADPQLAASGVALMHAASVSCCSMTALQQPDVFLDLLSFTNLSAADDGKIVQMCVALRRLLTAGTS
jgi:hypothetical protein